MPNFPRIRPCYRANSFSGSLALSFNRSSTIDERTCATLWCGISEGNDGFGEGNFKALFESIEEDQIRRGVLTLKGRA